jgi:sulfate transport system permease protein
MTRRVLIGIGIVFLTVFVVLPFGAVFSEAFKGGVKPYLDALANPDMLFAILFTVGVTLVAVPVTAAFGLFAAWLLARFRFPGRGLILGLIDLPFSLSPVLVGLLFVLLYGNQGLFGPMLQQAGIRVIFSWPSVILVTLFIILPFVVKELMPVLEERGQDEEEAAVTLGARGAAVFFRVTLPALKQALLYGVVLAAARGAGEFGAVNVVSGLIRGQTATLPIQIEIFYNDFATTAAFAGSTLFVVFALVSLAAQTVLKRRGGPK